LAVTLQDGAEKSGTHENSLFLTKVTTGNTVNSLANMKMTMATGTLTQHTSANGIMHQHLSN